MKILSLNNYHYLRGGSERYFLDQKSLLESFGHQVSTFSTISQHNELVSKQSFLVPALNVSKPRIADIGRFLYSQRNRAFLREQLSHSRPDIAHLHIYYGQLTASVLSELKANDIPTVQTLHDYHLYCPVSTFYSDGHLCQACKGKLFWHAITGRCNRGSVFRSLASAAETYVSHFAGAERSIDQFIAVSHFQRNKLIEMGMPADKVVTIHNFKDTTGVRPSVSQGKYFLYFGRLERIKGLFTLLNAVAGIGNIPLIVAGDGDARQLLEKEARERHLDHVSFVGFKHGDELEQLIRGSICTVLPSECWETFGITTLESFALGRAVVASRIGGIPETITSGENGFLVEPGSADHLRDRLLWMSMNPKQAIEMGKEGRRTVERNFNSSIHYERLMALYRKLARTNS